MRIILKELLVSFALTMLLFFILSIVLSTTNLSDSLMDVFIIGIVSFSLLVSGFRVAKNKKEKGIIFGSMQGVIYMTVLYIVSSLCNMDFSLSINSLIMIIFGIISGGIGGILGVNFLK